MSSRPQGQRQRAYSRPIPGRRNKAKAGWLMWWPVLLGIAVTPIARRAAAVLAMEGPAALRLLYPYVALFKLRLLHLPEEMGNDLSQMMMFLQFPLYGAFMALTMRSSGVVRALVWVVLLHALPIAFLMTVARL